MENDTFKKTIVRDIISSNNSLGKFLIECEQNTNCNAGQLKIVQNALTLVQKLKNDSASRISLRGRKNDRLRVNEANASEGRTG